MKYLFRQLEIIDFASLQELRELAPYEETLGTEQAHRDSYSRSRVESDLYKTSRTFGCFDGTQLVGACTIIERPDEPLVGGGWLVEGVPSGLLVNVAYRGQGIGRHLVERCLRSTIGRRVKGFTLKIRCPRLNPITDARKLYESFGFNTTTAKGAEEADPPSAYVTFTMTLAREEFVRRLRAKRKQAREQNSSACQEIQGQGKRL